MRIGESIVKDGTIGGDGQNIHRGRPVKARWFFVARKSIGKTFIHPQGTRP